ncbi:hypothetical protein [Niveibacterium sp. COAC-50]|uniref:hypothetical protein n=1 Tax=Niveibacterium sp. COAC-50 TaxID=2729384 RepID=UPI001555D8B2|nr:hypothetical protein [Niveibacterium sp. COAC-50]
MILLRVTYHVFEHELAGPWPTDRTSWHQLDGEVALTFSNDKTVFVSWGNTPLQYSIEQKGCSFFNAGVLTAVDMTQHPHWRPFIERDVTMNYIKNDHQVLSLTAGEESLFLTSQYDDGTFCGDCVRVSRAKPL